ncbi:MAG TPA: hypothetical protein VFZ27_06630 [Terriglobia bacterium]|nr:hypothetical protein [Terriglobia bacterium]
MRFSCFKCGDRIETADRVGTRATCPKCDADLHCCRNCRFYDPGKHNQCAEPQAEWVRDKEASNYCDYFQPNPVLLASGSGPGKENDARTRFDSLFKNS